MIGALPQKALVLADAGFVGYETWEALIDSGRHPLVWAGFPAEVARAEVLARAEVALSATGSPEWEAALERLIEAVDSINRVSGEGV